MSILSEMPPPREQDESGARVLVTAAGIGSAALVAALIYWRHAGRIKRRHELQKNGPPA